MSNLEIISIIALCLYVGHCQWQMLEYKEMKKRCKKYEGACWDCDCWSCPRKFYLKEMRFCRKVDENDQ